MKIIISILVLVLTSFITILTSCSKNSSTDETLPEVTTPPPNILFIIADDLGKDAINGFTEGSIKPTTPNIDAIRTNGVSFNNFWTYPTCSPTRASILTGKYGYRTNVKGAGDVLSPSEVSLQKYISDNTNNTYASALIGKWHLSGTNLNTNPELYGIDYYAGVIRGTVDNYFNWRYTEDAVTTTETTYATEKFTNLSIDWIGKQTKPWFLWLAYNAPHTPFHVPPSNMHSQGNLPAYTNGLNETPYYMAATEAMDFQIGRLLNAMSTAQRENTIIIFIGDNGTPNQVAQSPYSFFKAKNSLYQGGINCPMFISGKGVTRKGSDANLISSTDLFSTIAQIAGVSASTTNDSKSFKSLLTQASTIRSFQYSEMNNGNTDAWTLSNGSYKLIENANGSKEMYHLANDPYELSNLLTNTLSTTATNAKTSLETELASIRK